MALIGSGSMTNLHNLLYVSVNSCVFEHSLSFRKRKVAVIFFIVKLLMELDPSAAFTESHQRLSVSAECFFIHALVNSFTVVHTAVNHSSTEQPAHKVQTERRRGSTADLHSDDIKHLRHSWPSLQTQPSVKVLHKHQTFPQKLPDLSLQERWFKPSSFTKGNLIVREKKKAKNVNAEFNYRSLRYLNVRFQTKGACDGMKNSSRFQWHINTACYWENNDGSVSDHLQMFTSYFHHHPPDSRSFHEE